MSRGTDLRTLREAAGLQSSAVAHQANIHPSLLSRMETGKLPVGLDDYTRVLQAIMELREARERVWNEALAELGMGRAAMPAQREEKVA